MDRTAAVTALYVESFVEPLVQAPGQDGVDAGREPERARRPPRGWLARSWSFAAGLVAGRRPSCTVRSTRTSGNTFPVQGKLADAFRGNVAADLTTSRRQRVGSSGSTGAACSRCTSCPDRRFGCHHLRGRVLPVARRDRPRGGEARLLSWGLVAAVIGVSFLLLYGIVKQGSDTIGRRSRPWSGRSQSSQDYLRRTPPL